MLRLQRLQLRNFQTVQAAEIVFPPHGVVQVLGNNLSTGDRMTSVGSGKSAIADALGQTLFDIPGKFSRFGDYSRNGQGDTLVEVWCDLDGKMLHVQQGYKCPELSKRGEGLRYSYDGVEVERDRIDHTREELQRLIGVPPCLTKWTTIIDGDRMRLHRLPQAEIVEIIMAALRQPSWSSIRDKCKSLCDGFSLDKEQAEQQLATTRHEETVTKAAWEQTAQAQALALEEYEAACQKKAERAAQLQSEILLLEKQAKVAAKSRDQGLSAMEALERTVAEASAKTSLRIAELQSEIARVKHEVNEAVQCRRETYSIDSRDQEEAIKARKKSNIANWEAHRKVLEVNLKAIRKEKVEAQAKLSAAEREWQKAQATVETIERRLKALSAQSDACHECGQDLPKERQLHKATELAKAHAALKAGQEAFPALEQEEDACSTLCHDLEQIEQQILQSMQAPNSADAELEKMERIHTESHRQYVFDIEALRQTEALVPLQQELDQLSGTVNNAMRERMRELSHTYEQACAKCAEISELLRNAQSDLLSTQAPPDRSALTVAELRTQDKRQEYESAVSAKDNSTANLAESEAVLRVGKYWYEGFGPTGIPNVILRAAIDPLNQATQHVAGILTGGALSLTFAATRELASGQDKSEITISVANQFGSNSALGASKGESGLMGLIFSEVLQMLSHAHRTAGFRWYDEVINPQDAGVRTSFLLRQRALAHEQKLLIFVVDHHAGVEQYADHTLYAHKSVSGSTTYSWG